jgi:NAD(P)-dependent dehydrogenase (short-subunit alcohol dehydrogenase family)
MDLFEGRLAVVTGAGSGIGRELALQLAREGCHVALADVTAASKDETLGLCRAAAPRGTDFSTHVVDVSDAAAVDAFAEAVSDEHGADHINLLFNNAGISGGGSFVKDPREQWDRTFSVCWSGVYNCCRSFLPALLEASEGHVVNVSSVNGFWASLGHNTAHTAYSAAKFAVKGFSEALLNDFRINAPHLKVSVVMPGHIGTSIALNSIRAFGRTSRADGGANERAALERMGVPVTTMSDEEVEAVVQQMGEAFRDAAPTSAAEAATIILEGVREGRWRILVGADAHVLDELVREDPENAYGEDFMVKLRQRTDWFMP